MADITVTQAAQKRIKKNREQRKDEKLNLRVTVQAGGCSGFEYIFKHDADMNDDDTLFDECVVIDEISLNLLKGSEIDYVEELIGADFKINNPNAVSGCGCGTSFSITGF